MVAVVAIVLWIGSHTVLPYGEGIGYYTSAMAVESISWIEDSSDYIVKELSLIHI